MPLDKVALRTLESIAGPANVHGAGVELLTYKRDGGFDSGRPDAVVLPHRAEQVAEIVRWAHKAGLAIIAWGAGTGQTGGAVAERGGVVMSFANLRRLVDLDAEARQAVVEPGIINEQLDRAARAAGLTYPPDPASGRAATIGGNVAENAGGPRCLKYGVTHNYVLGLRTVLADGTEVEWGGPAADYPEVNFLDLIVGCEGTLALVTEARLRLAPVRPAVGTMLAAFSTTEAAGAAVSAIIGRGLRPAALELMDGLLYGAVEQYTHMNLPPGAGALLIADVEGYPEGLPAKVAQLEAIARQFEPLEVRLATGPSEREAIWYARKSAFAATALIAPDDCSMDVVVPRSLLPDAFREISVLGRQAGFQVGYLAHAGDGNIHPEIFCDLSVPGTLDRVHKVHDDVIRFVTGIGGSISGEHGIGLEKRRHLALMHGPAELQAMLDVKQSFDAQGTLNPGKIFPDALPALPSPNLSRLLPEQAAPGSWRPGSVGDLQGILAQLQSERTPAWLAGSGSTCASPSGSVRISMAGLTAIRAQAYDDLYVTVEAGARVEDVREALAHDGYLFPLAAPSREATVGGVIAAHINAPWRSLYGGVRDLLLCAEVVLPNGQSLKLGRPLMKDVAGYSLQRLFISSFGALGALTSLSLRVFPLPPVRRSLTVACQDLATALAAGRILARPADELAGLLLMPGRTSAVPAADGYRVICTLQGPTEDVALAEMHCRRDLTEARLDLDLAETPDSALDTWQTALRAAPWLMRLSAHPAQMPGLFELAQRQAPAAVLDLAGGLLWLAPGPDGQPAPRGLEESLRPVAEAQAGYALLTGNLCPPRGLRSSPAAARLFAALKRRWDPGGLLNPDVWP